MVFCGAQVLFLRWHGATWGVRGARSSGGCPYMGTRPADRQLLWSNFRPDFPAGLRASGESTHSWGWGGEFEVLDKKWDGDAAALGNPPKSHWVATMWPLGWDYQSKNVQIWKGRVEEIFYVLDDKVLFKVSNWCSLVELNPECQCWKFECFMCLIIFSRNTLEYLESLAETKTSVKNVDDESINLW